MQRARLITSSPLVRKTQTRLAFTIVERALEQVGASMEDVVRTRLFVRNLQRDGEAISRAHGEVRELAGSRRACCAAPAVGMTALAAPAQLRLGSLVTGGQERAAPPWPPPRWLCAGAGPCEACQLHGGGGSPVWP